MKLSELIRLQERCHGPACLERSVGDGYLYVNNPFFRRVRDAALGAGFRFSTRDPGGYFGFPLLGLDKVLESRQIPFRDNLTALEQLEAFRPGFFGLRDLTENRPTPNYTLHEAAHAVAYHEAFGKRCVREAFTDPKALLLVITGEAFAMTAEYLAACAVQGPVAGWLFSINSYRRRTQAKRPIGELIGNLGQPRVIWALLGAFVQSNFLRDTLSRRELQHIMAHCPEGSSADLQAEFGKLRSSVARAMQMSPEFRYETARLFLTKFGYPRKIENLLGVDPFQSFRADGAYWKVFDRLVALLVGDPARFGGCS